MAQIPKGRLVKGFLIDSLEPGRMRLAVPLQSLLQVFRLPRQARSLCKTLPEGLERFGGVGLPCNTKYPLVFQCLVAGPNVFLRDAKNILAVGRGDRGLVG